MPSQLMDSVKVNETVSGDSPATDDGDRPHKFEVEWRLNLWWIRWIFLEEAHRILETEGRELAFKFHWISS